MALGAGRWGCDRGAGLHFCWGRFMQLIGGEIWIIKLAGDFDESLVAALGDGGENCVVGFVFVGQLPPAEGEIGWM